MNIKKLFLTVGFFLITNFIFSQRALIIGFDTLNEYSFYKYDYFNNKKYQIYPYKSNISDLSVDFDSIANGIYSFFYYDIYLSSKNNFVDTILFINKQLSSINDWQIKTQYPGNYLYYTFKKDNFKDIPHFEENMDCNDFATSNHKFFEHFLTKTDSFIRRNRVTDDFYDIILKEIKLEEYNNIITELNYHNINIQNYNLPDISSIILKDSFLLYQSSVAFFKAIHNYYINDRNYNSSYFKILQLPDSEIKQLLLSTLLWHLNRKKVNNDAINLKKDILAKITFSRIIARIEDWGYNIDNNENEILKKISLKDINGKICSLSDIMSKNGPNTVLIDIWASWCSPCIRMSPYLKKIKEKFNGKGVEIYSISIDKDETEWKKAVKKHLAFNDKYNFVLANTVSRTDLLSIVQSSEVPRYLIIGSDGRIFDKKAAMPDTREIIFQIENSIELSKKNKQKR